MDKLFFTEENKTNIKKPKRHKRKTKHPLEVETTKHK